MGYAPFCLYSMMASRSVMTESVREIAEDVKKGKIKPSEIDMDTISSQIGYSTTVREK